MELSVYRKDNRKRAGRWRRRCFVGAACAALGLAAFAFHYWREPILAHAAAGLRFVVDNRYFSVREIQVRGGDKINGDEIVAMTGLRNGVNIWNVDPRAIEKKLAKHPWIRRVVVRREFPRKVVIEVEERVPKAIVALRRLYYVDGDGVIFKEVGEGENVKFPLLTGLRPEDLTAADPKTRLGIQDALRLSELMARDGQTLSEIHFDAAGRLIVYTTAYPIAFHMGWGDWEDKLQRLARVLSLWKGHEERLSALDVSFRDQVVARVRRATP